MDTHPTASRRVALVAMAIALPIAVAVGPVWAGGGDRDGIQGTAAKTWPREPYPPPRAIRRAQRFAAGWGDVSFAVIGSEIGLRGYNADTVYSSASASKALLLAARLRQLEADREPLDPGTRSLLEPMITYSDNDAASSIYAEVGDAGMEEVAERAGMRDFDVDPGFWGGAQVTAADMARFYSRLERNLGRRYRDYGLHLLANVTSTQRWGIPAALPHGWRVWFKGGWRPSGQEGTTGAVTHQAALLVHKGGERIALAILSNEAPGTGAGYDAIEGITERLLAKPPPRRSGWPVP